MNTETTRREFLARGGLSLMASALPAVAAEAKLAPPTEQEKANIDLVKQFLVSCSAKPFDPAYLVTTYFAANASVRWADDLPAAIGTADAIAAAKRLMPANASIAIETLDIFARGPLVATSRIDIVTIPGKPDVRYPIAGVHIVKDGKFIEYCDYIFKV